MQILVNTLAFLVALGVIVFVHEAGHLLVARACGIRVLVFSLGFGKRVWGIERGGTDWRISALPLGGYVRLAGENPAEKQDDPRSFHAHPRWQRILVYLGGPAANAVLAVALFAGLLIAGLDLPMLQRIPPLVGSVEAGSPAEQAGIRAGDVVRRIGERRIERWQDLNLEIMQSPNRRLAVLIERGEEELELALTPVPFGKYELGDAGLYPRVLPRVSHVVEDSPAAAVGLQRGDELRAIDGRAVSDPADFVSRISARPNQALHLEIVRAGEARVLEIVPRDVDGRGQIGVGLTIARPHPPLEAVAVAVGYCLDIVDQTFEVLGRLIRRELPAENALHGAIEIAAVSGEAARQGPLVLLHVIGLLSVSIGLLNLFPIPILDGGHIVVLTVESLIRRDLPLRVKEVINAAGAVLLLALTATVLYFDLARNLPALSADPAPTPTEAASDPP